MPQLDNINFTNQFFKKEHYEAFELQKGDDDNFDLERRDVADRLLDLDRLLWPEILKHNWKIHHHYMEEYWTSLWRVSQSRNNRLDAVWLHYGKSETELEPYRRLRPDEKETFIYHIRLQVAIRYDKFEINLMLGKDNGGSWDRGRYHDLMAKSDSRNQIFNLLSQLDSQYWLDFNGSGDDLKVFKTADELWKHTRIDKPSEYFSFGKSYEPDDKSISKDSIVKTVIDEFKKLYPLYDIIKHRL